MNSLVFPCFSAMQQNSNWTVAASNILVSDKVKQLYIDAKKKRQPTLALGKYEYGRIAYLETRGIYYENRHVSRLVLEVFKNGVRWSFIMEGRPQTFRLPNENAQLYSAIFQELNGAEQEALFPNDQEEPIMARQEWGVWWKEPLEPGDAIHHYRGTLYPYISQAIQGIFAFLGHPLKVLDVGGGNGECACTVLNAGNVSSYLLLEQNQEAIAEAQRLKSTLIMSQQGIWDVVERDLVQDAPFVDGNVHVTILSGVLAVTVLTRQDSLSILDRSIQATVEGGFLVITSYSDPYFQSVDFWEKGLEIFNMTSCNRENVVDSFYILRKKPQTLLKSLLPSDPAILKLIVDYV